MRIAYFVLALISCGEPGDNALNVDDDGDGYSEFEGDCDDKNPDLSPADLDNEAVDG